MSELKRIIPQSQIGIISSILMFVPLLIMVLSDSFSNQS